MMVAMLGGAVVDVDILHAGGSRSGGEQSGGRRDQHRAAGVPQHNQKCERLFRRITIIRSHRDHSYRACRQLCGIRPSLALHMR